MSNRPEINFASDNVAGVAPEILAALTRANTGTAMPYGGDEWTEQVGTILSGIFEREVAAFPVATGTSANALALATGMPPYGQIFCHESAHIEEDEAGAPEFYSGGAKLTVFSGENGKLSANDLAARLASIDPDSAVHHPLPSAVSITQTTEKGTVYSLDEIAAISQVAHDHGLTVHMDGARFANALVALDVTPAEMTWKAGIDVLSLGATKNGAMAAEAVVFFDPAKAADFEFRRKRGGHLVSKMRFISSQLIGYLQDDVWLSGARNANAAAARLDAGLQDIPGVEILFPVQANMMFVTLSEPVLSALQEEGCRFYTWGETPDGGVSARLVTTFNTTEEETARFLDAARLGAGLSVGSAA